MYKHLYKYRHYLLSAIILTGIFSTMYVLVQQQGRMQANDTPALLATQVAELLDAGLGLQSASPSLKTDLANNPMPFVIIYDTKGKAVGGSGYLDKKLAVAPKSMLQHAKADRNNTVTWQPKSGVRIASVTIKAKDYYVLGGQSLKATEDHASQLLKLTALGYGASLAVLAGYVCLSRFAGEKNNK